MSNVLLFSMVKCISWLQKSVSDYKKPRCTPRTLFDRWPFLSHLLTKHAWEHVTKCNYYSYIWQIFPQPKDKPSAFWSRHYFLADRRHVQN